MPGVPPLLVVGVGQRAARAVGRIVDSGVDVVAVTADPDDQLRATGARCLRADHLDEAAVLAALERADIRGAAGVLGLANDNEIVVSALARRFGRPGVAGEAARTCTFKDRRIAALQAAGVDVPRHRIADTADGVRDALRDLGSPVVVKPSDLSESLGVGKVTSPAAVDDAVRTVRAHSPDAPLVVEEYLQGTEHTLGGIVRDGRVEVVLRADRDYSAKERYAPHIFESGDTFPSALSPAQLDRCDEAVRTAVTALRVDSSAFTADLLVPADGRVVVLEIACRIPGAGIATELGPLATGLDLLALAVSVALNHEIEPGRLRPTVSHPVVQRYRPCNGELVLAVGPLPDVPAGNLHEIYWSTLPVPGTRLPHYRSAHDLLAGAIAVGASVAEADRAANRALDALPLTLAPQSGFLKEMST